MSAKTILSSYCESMSGKNVRSVVGLFDAQGFLEFPFIGQRLVGVSEINAGLSLAFERVESIAVDIRDVKSLNDVAIGEAVINVKLKGDDELLAFPASIVVKVRNDRAQRISVYLNAYQARLWVDGPVLIAN